MRTIQQTLSRSAVGFVQVFGNSERILNQPVPVANKGNALALAIFDLGDLGETNRYGLEFESLMGKRKTDFPAMWTEGPRRILSNEFIELYGHLRHPIGKESVRSSLR